MTDLDYNVLTVDKPDNVTVEQAAASLAEQYPDHVIEVQEVGDQFLATLARKSKVSRTVVADDDEALDLLDTPPAPPKGESDDEDKELDEVLEDGPKDDDKPKKDDEDKEEGEGKDALSQVVEALKTLDKFLPKIKEQLHLDGGPEKPLGPPEGMPPLPDEVGPTPGKPPVGPPAGPPAGGPPAGPPGGGRPPRGGPGKRPGPPVGVPTFGSTDKENKKVFRPVANEDGTETSLAEATQEISAHPRYANYELRSVKQEGDQFVAHLKLRKE